MRSKLTILIIGLCLGLAVQAETTITYQGQLQDSGGPVTDTLEMVFRLFDDATGPNQIGSDIVDPEVSVTDGLFQVELDFGAAYDGQRWLEVEVAGTVLDPRQPITPTPLAVRALSADDAAFSAGDGLMLSDATFSLDSDFTDALYWRQGGNAATDPASDFLGTTDDTPFEVHVDGERVFRIEPADAPNIIGGWAGNAVAADVIGATIGGGGCPAIDSESFPCNSDRFNDVTSDFGTIGGGVSNTASGHSATVGGGFRNTASGSLATAGGGQGNTPSGTAATVGGGVGNTASGSHSTVPGGSGNMALGDYSFAAGRGAKAEHHGAFVWADNTFGPFASTDEYQFLIRASGGVGINTNAPLRSGLHVKQRSGSPSEIGLVLERSGSSTSNWSFYVATSDNLGFRFNDDLVARINSDDGEFVPLSDARRKDSIEPLSGALDRVLQLQPSSYFMKTDHERERRSVGLIAQEVKDVFPSAVSSIEDVYGVSYNQITVLNTAAIIELNERIQQELEAQHRANKQLQAQVSELQALLEDSRAELARERVEASDLHERLARLEAVLLDKGQMAARD